MPRIGKSKISKIKFHSVMRDIKSAKEVGNYNALAIAETHHVSRETVNAIRRAKTWPGFILAKQSTNTLRARAKADEHDALVANRKTAGDNIRTRDDRFDQQLDAITEAPVSRHEHEQLHDAVRRLRLRVEALENYAAQPKRGWFARTR